MGFDGKAIGHRDNSPKCSLSDQQGYLHVLEQGPHYVRTYFPGGGNDMGSLKVFQVFPGKKEL